MHACTLQINPDPIANPDIDPYNIDLDIYAQVMPLEATPSRRLHVEHERLDFAWSHLDHPDTPIALTIAVHPSGTFVERGGRRRRCQCIIVNRGPATP